MADKLGVTGNTWWFLQGKKDLTYQLAEKNYLVAVKQDNTVKGGYTHQGYFVLVDKQKRVRGAYDGTNPQQVGQLIDDIKILQAEPGPANNNEQSSMGALAPCFLFTAIVMITSCQNDNAIEFNRYYSSGSLIYKIIVKIVMVQTAKACKALSRRLPIQPT